ncbi:MULTISPECIES: hypothetical protein [unclassified Sphingomonas]|nr:MULTISPECIES: hypothetical protein [unclassified Sphingomonas]
MIDPMPPRRDEEGWHGVCLFFVVFFLLMLSGVVRAWIGGRL